MNRQAKALTKGYWRSFALRDEELEHLHDLIVEEGIPQTEAFLAYDLVARRCEQEEACKAAFYATGKAAFYIY